MFYVNDYKIVKFDSSRYGSMVDITLLKEQVIVFSCYNDAQLSCVFEKKNYENAICALL